MENVHWRKGARYPRMEKKSLKASSATRGWIHGAAKPENVQVADFIQKTIREKMQRAPLKCNRASSSKTFSKNVDPKSEKTEEERVGRSFLKPLSMNRLLPFEKPNTKSLNSRFRKSDPLPQNWDWKSCKFSKETQLRSYKIPKKNNISKKMNLKEDKISKKMDKCEIPRKLVQHDKEVVHEDVKDAVVLHLHPDDADYEYIFK